jgi:alpha(1,3/1,4) fucosyltransferase
MKIAFSDFWPEFDSRDNFLTSIFRALEIPFEVVDDDADLLIASCFGFSWMHKQAGKKIYWTGENWYRMDDPIREMDGRRIIDCFDMVYSFDYNDYKNHYRVPLYLLDCVVKGITDFSQVIRTKSREQLRSEFPARKFCTFVQGNSVSPFRNEYFHRLNEIERVDSFGPVFNNTGIVVDRAGKIQKTRGYKFALAFENSAYAGYLVSDVIPIYWGGSRVGEELNDKAFVDVGSLGTERSLALVRKLNRDFDLYWEYYRQPVVSVVQLPLSERIEGFYRSLRQCASQ